MTRLRAAWVLGAFLSSGSPALAAAPAGQGRACDAKTKCDGGLACVAHSGGKSTCELVCEAKTKCPEDQRCVRDGAQSVCRPVTDL